MLVTHVRPRNMTSTGCRAGNQRNILIFSAELSVINYKRNSIHSPTKLSLQNLQENLIFIIRPYCHNEWPFSVTHLRSTS